MGNKTSLWMKFGKAFLFSNLHSEQKSHALTEQKETRVSKINSDSQTKEKQKQPVERK